MTLFNRTQILLLKLCSTGKGNEIRKHGGGGVVFGLHCEENVKKVMIKNIAVDMLRICNEQNGEEFQHLGSSI